jgi:hypothetical protein
MGISRKIQIKYFEGLVLKYDTIGRYEPCRYEPFNIYIIQNLILRKTRVVAKNIAKPIIKKKNN